MKKIIFTKVKVNLWAAGFFLISLFSSDVFAQYPAGSPVAINGKLKLVGNQLSNECGNPVQLRGMSTHGPQWFPNCYSTSALDALTNSWGIDVFRLAMYVHEGGYLNNPNYWKGWIDNMVTECGNRGIYVMIDWHILSPGDPWASINEAREFWTYMSAKHSGKKHVLYEICNEPNGVDWARVKSYADDIIPRIRANDQSTVIIVGTPTWSQDVDIAANNKLNYPNIMYTLHFYSGTHTDFLRSKANTALSKGIAIFVTEFGTSQATGDGGPYLTEAQKWLDWCAANKISWINWSFADKNEVSAALNSGSCGGNWNNTSQSGTFIKQRISSPADNFVCNGTPPPPPPPVTQSPYGGTAWPIPGKIEAERYDNGGSGVAYNDVTAGNSGSAFRTEDVDIEATTDAGAGYNVGWTAAGEWLEYTVNVSAAGKYDFKARVAAISTGKLFRIEMNNVNVTGTISVPNTGGWQAWQTVTVPGITLNAGTQVMRIYMITDGFNINFVDVTSSTVTPPPPPPVNQAPSVSISSPANNSSFTAPASITITANASDSDGSVSKVEFFSGATKLGEDLTSPYSFAWSNVAAGSYTLTARATDNAGAVTTSAAVNISVTTTPPVNQAPSVSISSPANNSSFTAPASITISANASDSDGTVSKVEFFSGATKLGEDLTSPYNFAWSNVAAGSYSLTAKATDNSGAVTTSSAVTVTVTSAPVGNCPVNAVPPASQWTLRNDWTDQNNGSVVSNTTDALNVTHRQWGRNQLWVIESGKTMTLTSGTQYTIKFDFRNDASNPVTSVDVGFATSFDWGNAILAQPVVSTSGFSSSAFTTKTVTITASTNATVYLVFRLNWGGQPNTQTNMYFKNISACSPTARMSSVNTPAGSSAMIYEATPNPFEGQTMIKVSEDLTIPMNLTVADISGRVVYESEVYSTNEEIFLGNELKGGIYIVQASYSGKVVTFKLVKN